MYGIPSDFPQDMFVGKIVELITFSTNQVVLHFSENIGIAVESSFSLMRPGEACRIQRIPLTSSDLIRIIGHEVSKVTIENTNKTLLFAFPNGEELRLYDDSDSYESLRIDLQGKEIIV